MIFYELFNGVSPFVADDPLATYQKVLDGKIDYPQRMPTHAIELTVRLLERNVSKRFGNLANGANDIKAHKFYAAESTFRWENAYEYRGSLKIPPEAAAAAVAPTESNPQSPVGLDWLPAMLIATDKRPCAPADAAIFAEARL